MAVVQLNTDQAIHLARLDNALLLIVNQITQNHAT
jgi:hypothetical protein